MLHLINLLCIYNIYCKYHNIIYDVIKDNKELVTLYKYVSNLITKYERDITYEELALYILVNIVEKDKEKYSILLKDLKEQTTSTLLLDDLLIDLVQKHKAQQLALLAIEVTEGSKSFSDLLLLTQELNSTTALTDTLEGHYNFITDDLLS